MNTDVRFWSHLAQFDHTSPSLITPRPVWSRLAQFDHSSPSLITPRPVWSHLAQSFLEWKIVSDKSCRANRNSIFMLDNFFRKSCCLRDTWKNIVQPDRPQMTVWCMHTACWIPKATNTHSQYVILIACPQQQWLYKGASKSRYMFAACLATQ